MPGEPLMCVWQTACVLDQGGRHDKVQKTHLKTIAEKLDSSTAHINYSRKQFEDYFTQRSVEFPPFKQYVTSSLLDPGVSLLVVMADIENSCWQLVQDKYSSKRLNGVQVRQLWEVFSRLSVVGSYPPTINNHMIKYLFDIIAKKLKTTSVPMTDRTHESLTFPALLRCLETWLFSRKSNGSYVFLPVPRSLKLFCCGRRHRVSPSQDSVSLCLDHISTWLVQEVIKVGWLNMHIRRGANWSSWTKYWCVLTPGCLKYYKVADHQDTLKGQIFLDKDTEVLEEDNKTQNRTSFMRHKFKVLDSHQEVELCPENDSEKQSWVYALNDSVRAVRTGISPQMRLLTERVKLLEADLVAIDQKLDEAQQAAGQAFSHNSPDNEEDDADAAVPFNEDKTGIGLQQSEEPPDAADQLNDALTMQREKLQSMFLSIDKDGNGKINREEFKDYIDSLGAKVDEKETNLMFDSIDKDNNNFIFFEEFEDFFKSSVFGEEDETNSMATLRSAFLQADQDGSGAVSFQEFSEYAYAMRRDLAMEQLLASFHKLDSSGDGEISFQEFEKFLDDSTMKDLASKSSKSKSASAESFLKNMYQETDVNELVELLGSRWNKFSNFQRYGDKGELVMKGEKEQVTDIIPGNYSLVDLACFNDMPPIEPNKVVIKGVKWCDSTIPGRSGKAIFPSDFDGKVPTEIATNEHLAYYGCSLADRNQTKVSLFYRHGIQDFTYQNNYLSDYVTAENANGGAGIEHHSFSHLDCPMDAESGVFVIGKFVDDELHLTGFKVPTRHTLYVPGDVIHSNDYLRGTWRTMLSDEAAINHVHLVKMAGDNGKEEQHFVFSFQALM